MANQKKKQPKSWQGDEVEPTPGTEAEDAAQRAEGNGPIDAAEAARSDDTSGDTANRPARSRGVDDEEAKIAEAAEAHRARRASGDGPPRKTL